MPSKDKIQKIKTQGNSIKQPIKSQKQCKPKDKTKHGIEHLDLPKNGSETWTVLKIVES